MTMTVKVEKMFVTSLISQSRSDSVRDCSSDSREDGS